MKKAHRDDEGAKWAKLLRRLAECVESAQPADLEELIAGNARLQIRTERRQASIASTPASNDRTDWLEIVSALRSLPTREAGAQRLKEVASSKAQLERLARAMDLPIAKHENADQLRERIIEASIGSRLVSRAIRGEVDTFEEK